MVQENITQRKVVMRGAMDRCCNLWAPILPPADVLTPIAIPDQVDLGEDPSQDADSDVSGLPSK